MRKALTFYMGGDKVIGMKGETVIMLRFGCDVLKRVHIRNVRTLGDETKYWQLSRGNPFYED